MKWIKFKYCYYLLIINVVSIGLGILLYFIKSISQAPAQMVGFSVGSLINIYIYLGLLKYSYIYDQTKFRKIIFLTLSLSVIYSIGHIMQKSLTFTSSNDNYWFVFAALEAPLLFYAFRLIKNKDVIYFSKLSRFYLYQLIAVFFILIGYFVSLSYSYQFILMVPFVIAGFVYVILIWYWKIKLFKHLASKHE